jgi:hypothetical protein
VKRLRKKAGKNFRNFFLSGEYQKITKPWLKQVLVMTIRRHHRQEFFAYFRELGRHSQKSRVKSSNFSFEIVTAWCWLSTYSCGARTTWGCIWDTINIVSGPTGTWGSQNFSQGVRTHHSINVCEFRTQDARRALDHSVQWCHPVPSQVYIPQWADNNHFDCWWLVGCSQAFNLPHNENTY